MSTPADALSAITAAVRGDAPPASPPAAAAPPADPPAGDDPPPPAAPAGDDTPPAAPAGAAPDLIGKPPEDPPPAGAPVIDARGRAHDPVTGQLLPGPAAAPAAAAVPPVAAAAPAAAPVVLPVRQVDPVNDPIPENVKPATRDRITQLVEKVKAADADLTTTRNDFETLMQPITEAGATVEQFRESMTLLKYINSPHQHEQAMGLKFLQEAVASLSERLGVVPPGVDALAGHEDLLAAVRANQMPRQYAEEVARSRRLTIATQQHGQLAQQRTQQQEERNRQVAQGQNSVREVEQGFQAIDPQYAAKIAVMRADTAFVNQLRTLHPTQWAPAFAQKYRTVKVAPPVAAPAPSPSPVVPAPLRAKQPAGATVRPPNTALEAVRGALGA